MRSSVCLVILVVVCTAGLGCVTTRAERDEEIKQLRDSADQSHAIADQMMFRGDRDPERRAAIEQSADELYAKANELENGPREEEKVPCAVLLVGAVGEAIVEGILNSIFSDDDDDDDDDCR